jgi:hypothetical protein
MAKQNNFDESQKTVTVGVNNHEPPSDECRIGGKNLWSRHG